MPRGTSGLIRRTAVSLLPALPNLHVASGEGDAVLLETRAFITRTIDAHRGRHHDTTQAPQRRCGALRFFGDLVHFRLNFVVFSCPRQVNQPSFNDAYVFFDVRGYF